MLCLSSTEYELKTCGAGNKIADLMQKLCSRRINYYFAAITQYTDKMAHIMRNCYAHSHNAEFKVRPSGHIWTSSHMHSLLTASVQQSTYS